MIAEAGVNHNGHPELALRLVDAAADAGADAVKFQTFRAAELVSRNARKATYQQATTDPEESQFAMIRRLELDHATHLRLADHCRARGIAFLSTPFDLPSLEFLVAEMDLPLLKIPSGEVTNGPFLVRVGATGRRILLSTGMATLGEIETALGALAFGLLGLPEPPSLAGCAGAFASPAGQAILEERVTLLHCTTEYPAPVDQVNLRAMDAMAAAFGLPVGYSDHTAGIAIPIAAVARGAVVIEKHFTLDRTLPGPDHRASLEPDELAAMVRAIREVETALQGHGHKLPMAAEWKNRAVARKSLVAIAPVAQGECFSEHNLGIKRPGSGISPMAYWQWLGRAAPRDYQPDELIVDRGESS
ncbi:MAG: N-acetylneuraminate synthase [Magnetococcales bacterium]|nr:N-acetylneuraminate synthase [Magnetococcales bacterium]